MKTYTTYVVTAKSTSRHGLNTSYYFRTEQEAKLRLAEYKKFYKDIPSQTFELTSHDWSN